MLMLFLTGLAQAVGLLLVVALVWGVPLYFISRERHVPEQERKICLVASIFFPWDSFLAFMLVAPVTHLGRD